MVNITLSLFMRDVGPPPPLNHVLPLAGSFTAVRGHVTATLEATLLPMGETALLPLGEAALLPLVETALLVMGEAALLL